MIETGPDAVTRALNQPRSRRAALRLLAGAALGGALVARQVVPAAADGLSHGGWYFCPKCAGLFYSSRPTDPAALGLCPAGAQHRYLGGRGYILFANFDPSVIQPNYEDGWRFCFKCSVMHYALGGSLGTCPAGGTHSNAPSNNYQIWRGGPQFAAQQRGWRQCAKCRGLWYVGNGTRGVCPTTGAGHTPVAGGAFCLIRA